MTRTGEDLTIAAALALLVACIATSAVALSQSPATVWDGASYVLVCSLAAVESYYSHRSIFGGQEGGIAGRASRIAELAALFVLLQLLVDLQNGTPVVSGRVPHLDQEAGLLFIPIAFIWVVCGNVARIVAELRQPAGSPVLGLQLVAPERRLATRFLLGGLILFVLAGLTQPRIADFVRLPPEHHAGPVLNVFIYFLVGMSALGLLHYATLRQRWQHQQVVIARGLQARWMRYTLVFLALMVLVALILPTSRTAGLLDPWGQAWTQIVLALRGPLEWLARLLSRTSQLPRPEHLPTVTPPPHFHPPPPVHHAGKPGKAGWGALAQAAFFWGVVAVAALYILRAALRGRIPHLRLPGRLGAVFAAIGRLLDGLRRLFRGSAEALTDRFPSLRLARTRTQSRAGGLRRLLPIGAADPREQVMRYYLATVQRAEQEGFPRRRDQSPHEFGAALALRLPEAEGDMTRLTDAFVEARYSRHQIDPDRLGALRVSWQRMRDALRALRTAR